MLAYEVLKPAADNGAIIRLKHSAVAAYQPFLWDTQARSWVRSDIAIDRFMSLPRATPSELLAVGLTFRDIEEP